jgi:putative ABC transport system permease protein
MADQRGVTEDYFRTMMIPLRRGRTFTRDEVESPKSRVIVVNETFVHTAWPGQDAIGKSIRFHGERRVVIGVVGDARQLGPDSSISPEIYVPGDQFSPITLVVRTSGDPARLTPALSRALWSIDKDQAIQHTQTMHDSLGEWVAERRFVMTLLGSFAGLALMLAAAGIYGVLAYSVTQRTREIGIRMAVGANAADISKLVLREGVTMALAGVAAGIAGAVALTRLLSGLLFEVRATDPLTFGFGAFALMSIAVLASFVPAIRAAKLAPLEALREE